MIAEFQTRTATTLATPSAPASIATTSPASSPVRAAWRQVWLSFTWRGMQIGIGAAHLLGGIGMILSQIVWIVLEPAYYAAHAAWITIAAWLRK